jgi:hypothetical protein
VPFFQATTGVRGSGVGADSQSWFAVTERRTRPATAALQPPLWASTNVSIATFTEVSSSSAAKDRFPPWPLRVEGLGPVRVAVAKQPPPPLPPRAHHAGAHSLPPSPPLHSQQHEEEMQFMLTDDDGADLTDGAGFEILNH